MSDTKSLILGSRQYCLSNFANGEVKLGDGKNLVHSLAAGR